MKILNQLVLILSILLIGEFISLSIADIIVIPGSIVGIILLFILLQLKVIKLEKIEEVSNFLLNNMAVFFIPAGVSLINSIDIISKNLVVLLITIIVSTVLVMSITAVVVEKMINNKES